MAVPESVAQEAAANLEVLAENPYPGRGIIMGRLATGELAQVYWIMGRSENSRNRVFVEEGDIVKTEAADSSKVRDPSLIIYNAMRVYDSLPTYHIVSNGDQTDTVINNLMAGGQGVEIALQSRDYEPDAPNYTPRITGIIKSGWPGGLLWVTRRGGEFGDVQHNSYIRDLSVESYGYCVHTYEGDGDPLPSFTREPYLVPLGEDASDTAAMYWETLSGDNLVSLVVKAINANNGEFYHQIMNGRTQVPAE